MKNKKTLFVILLPLLIISMYWFVLLLIHYFPFLRERTRMSSEVIDNKTIFKDDSFNFSFEISSKCYIDSGILNHLAGGYWSGKLFCDNSDDYIIMHISNNTVESLSRMEILGGFKRIYGGNIKPGYFDLRIIDKEKKKVFAIIGNDYSQNVWNDILRTIQETN